jgi:hypothetical protein
MLGGADMSALAPVSTSGLRIVAGGVESLHPAKARLIRAFAGLVRRLSHDQAILLFGILEEFERDGYLERLQGHEPPIVKIFAEVANGWDEQGAYEFARAWASTLVAREDGFCWDRASPEEKKRHRARIIDELGRRGVLPPAR